MPVASQTDVLDLRHFSARQLRPLLEQEARVWRERLRWDYASSTELLLQYLDSRILPGFVALDRGRICGFTFCVYEGQKAVIGDAFAAGHRAAGDVETAKTLLLHMLEMLRSSPGVDRVESQLLLYDTGDFADIFSGPEFTLHRRLFLECDLRLPSGMPQAAGFPTDRLPGSPDFTLSPWSAQDYQAAGELIHACYIGHADADINDQYRSLHGSLRFLHNIVRFPGCGVFLPEFSWVLRNRRTGAMAGMVLCSRVASDVAHITQLCVAPEARGHGLGRTLLERCARSLVQGRFAAITLTVTEGNLEAVRLYQRFGFFARHRFDAMVLDNRRGL